MYVCIYNNHKVIIINDYKRFMVCLFHTVKLLMESINIYICSLRTDFIRKFKKNGLTIAAAHKKKNINT